MQLTSTFVLAALIALRATGVASLPVTTAGPGLDTRDLTNDNQLDARGFFANRIGHEENTIDREAARIRAQEHHLHEQQKDIRLQEQMHRDHQLLRANRVFRRSEPDLDARGFFANKIGHEENAIGREAAHIKAEEYRLHQQQNRVNLQEQIHHDHRILRANGVFRRSEPDLDARGFFANKIGHEENAIGREAAHIKAEEYRLHQQQNRVNLQEQIHHDHRILRANGVYPRSDISELDARGFFANKIGHEESTIDREAAHIKAEEYRLHQQQNRVNLQEQIHHDRHVLHQF